MTEREQELLHRLLLNLFLESPRRVKRSQTEATIDTTTDRNNTQDHQPGGTAHAKKTEKTVHPRGTI
jgi:hypothetical protein